MAGIQLSGLASGLDTGSIVTQLMSIEKLPRTRITNDQALVAARRTNLTTIQSKLQTLKDDEKGASAVEYAILVGAIAVVLAVAAVTLAGKIGTALGKILP